MSRAPLRWRILLPLLMRMPQGLLSRMTGRLLELPIPRALRGAIIGTFARIVGIRSEEAEAPPGSYPSVGAYFVRRLGPGVRDWRGPDDLPGSPVDGVVGAGGTITEGLALQAKGLEYSVRRLLAGVEGTDGSRWWEGGRFLTLYLSPRHYHRIHWPVTGRITGAVSVPGRLLPVNDAAVSTIPDLFPRNERMVVQMESASGPLAVVAVGAFNVGRISASFEPAWAEGATNRPDSPAGEPDRRRYDPPIDVEQGADLGAFHLGSTVVLVFGPGFTDSFAAAIRRGREVRVGEPLFRRLG